MVDEGIYELHLAAVSASAGQRPPERTEALAILRDGRVLGSDAHGGLFIGRYRYDPACGEAIVDLRLTVPPHGVLLTGLAAGPEGLMLDLSGRFVPPRPVSKTVVEVAGAAVSVELRYVGPWSGA